MTGAAGPKRFYQAAAAVPLGDGHTVALDGRPVRTPLKSPLSLPTRPLAEAIAAEWAAQGERIDFRTMPLMGVASAAVDQIVPRRDDVIGELVAFGGTDLLCYRAESPPALVARQAAAWQPRLDWLAETHGIRLRATTGVIHLAQDAAALERLREVIAGQANFALAALHVLTTGTGSTVLALSVAAGQIDAAAAAKAGHLDELFQAEQWGEEPLAVERRDRISGELIEAERFLRLATMA